MIKQILVALLKIDLLQITDKVLRILLLEKMIVFYLTIIERSWTWYEELLSQAKSLLTEAEDFKDWQRQTKALQLIISRENRIQ